jgi:hypothetical protein
MAHRVLVGCLGILAAVAVACVPAVSVPRPAESSRHVHMKPRVAGQICDGTADSFIQAIQLLNTSYDPAPGHGAYTPPPGSNFPWLPDPSAADPIRDDLKQAFANAPQFFKNFLCGLNGVYIDSSQCTGKDPRKCGGPAYFDRAWGFRSRHQTDLGFRYIAISATLWQNGASAPPLTIYENWLMQSFLPSGNSISVSSANPNTSWMTVLAALAHEAGHVTWAETVIPTVGNAYNFDPLISCAAGDFFIGWDYGNNPNKLRPKNRWRPFKNQENGAGSITQHKNPPSLADLAGLATVNSAIYQLYQSNQPWASLFAAHTPDEDFVESYAMAVLTGYNNSSQTFDGPLTSLPINIPQISVAPDVAKDLVGGNKAALLNKLKCIPY